MRCQYRILNLFDVYTMIRQSQSLDTNNAQCAYIVVIGASKLKHCRYLFHRIINIELSIDFTVELLKDDAIYL